MNTAPDVQMNATFAPTMPPPGPVAFMSQSGAMGLSVLDYAHSLGIGFSSFVSAGNKTDVSGNDCLVFWEDDPHTSMILMYLENFGNPKRFVELGRRVTRTKPICVVKSGRTGAGERAAASHTGALAGTELATDAIIRQAGAIRAETIEELFDLAMALSNQPLPAGNRVAIVTNAGGPGIMIADACEQNGLVVTPLTPETEAELRTGLPEEASVRNPVDMIASARAESYEFALDHVLSDPNVDAAFAAFVPPLGIQTRDVAEAIVRVNAKHPAKPMLAVLMGREGLPAGLEELHDAQVPAYIFPESAARALSAMWRYAQARSRPEGKVVSFAVDDDAVATIIDATLARNETKVSEPDAIRILEAYGIPVVPWRYVPKKPDADCTAAVTAAARELGFPVVLKAVSPDITHKSDVGAVALDLADGAAVAGAIRTMLSRIKEHPPVGPAARRPAVEGFVIQKLAPPGREVIIGLNRMPRVGAMIMFGLGGVYVEVMRDVVLRLAPLMDQDAHQMIHEVRMVRLLEGIRGEPPRDLAALEDVLLRVSQLAEHHPRLAEMDINPLFALEQGAVAVDARVELQADPPISNLQSAIRDS
jgi:acyl-CoA synthetase (NDP forming)